MNPNSKPSEVYNAVVKGDWNKVVDIYQDTLMAESYVNTVNRDTILHVAAQTGQTEMVEKLMPMVPKEDLSKTNEQGNTPLHEAAIRGSVGVCRALVKRYKGEMLQNPLTMRNNLKSEKDETSQNPLTMRNKLGETPLFLAAEHGHEKAFKYLVYQVPALFEDGGDRSALRRDDGHNVLHSAIEQESFSLALDIINNFSYLAEYRNEKGLTPLEILTRMPSAFKSGCRIRVFERLLYRFISVQLASPKVWKPLKDGKHAGKDQGEEYEEFDEYWQRNVSSKFPSNYGAVLGLSRMVCKSMGYFFGTKEGIIKPIVEKIKAWKRRNDGDIESQKTMTRGKNQNISGEAQATQPSSQSQNENVAVDAPAASQSQNNGASFMKSAGVKKSLRPRYPRIYNTLLMIVHLLVTSFTVVLGLGYLTIRSLKEKKKKHKLAKVLVKALAAEIDLQEKPGGTVGGQGDGTRPESEKSSTAPPFLSSSVPPTGSATISQQPPVIPFPKPSQQASVIPFPKPNGSGGIDDKNDSDGTNYVALFGNKAIGSGYCGFYGIAPVGTGVGEKPKASTTQTSMGSKLLQEATKNGILEVVKVVLHEAPDSFAFRNEGGKNVIHLAVEYRQPLVFKYIADSGLPWASARRERDAEDNTLLHLAAKLPEQTYEHSVVQGAALHMQWELQWYELVRKYVPVHFSMMANKDNRTPIELLRSSHRNLVKQGSEWLTKTAESCSLVAGLISTVCFAAGFTLPGGTNQESGEPVLMGSRPFTIFVATDLLALAFSVTALIMFLAILTSRFQESDFHLRLPRRLLVGLTSLFISITAMLVAFSSGLIPLLHGHLKNLKLSIILVPSFPIAIFALDQLPLYLDLLEYNLADLPQLSYKDDIL
ncbi:uncharacterized protein LOC18429610 isoform X1 [Amborella trichopoda]|uniref:PGG domain-containing protein n=1 Tax=Amborella trichopoda TaxID=13333 RepID=W1P1S8_AMBTC|nr:uncharacterized protein LOC18429610 isoform X1 [Amborella trichopoda]ERN01526.1 hypothetical protein AMTR_s00002p00270930 [Amborella trichopoda]|eukprot:XP_020520230.1 uncharacterized protein LOC18429610 isoform X1 [Amborella trichopoda]